MYSSAQNIAYNSNNAYNYSNPTPVPPYNNYYSQPVNNNANNYGTNYNSNNEYYRYLKHKDANYPYKYEEIVYSLPDEFYAPPPPAAAPSYSIREPEHGHQNRSMTPIRPYQHVSRINYPVNHQGYSRKNNRISYSVENYEDHNPFYYDNNNNNNENSFFNRAYNGVTKTTREYKHNTNRLPPKMNTNEYSFDVYNSELEDHHRFSSQSTNMLNRRKISTERKAQKLPATISRYETNTPSIMANNNNNKIASSMSNSFDYFESLYSNKINDGRLSRRQKATPSTVHFASPLVTPIPYFEEEPLVNYQTNINKINGLHRQNNTTTNNNKSDNDENEFNDYRNSPHHHLNTPVSGRLSRQEKESTQLEAQQQQSQQQKPDGTPTLMPLDYSFALNRIFNQTPLPTNLSMQMPQPQPQQNVKPAVPVNRLEDSRENTQPQIKSNPNNVNINSNFNNNNNNINNNFNANNNNVINNVSSSKTNNANNSENYIKLCFINDKNEYECKKIPIEADDYQANFKTTEAIKKKKKTKFLSVFKENHASNVNIDNERDYLSGRKTPLDPTKIYYKNNEFEGTNKKRVNIPIFKLNNSQSNQYQTIAHNPSTLQNHNSNIMNPEYAMHHHKLTQNVRDSINSEEQSYLRPRDSSSMSVNKEKLYKMIRDSNGLVLLKEIF